MNNSYFVAGNLYKLNNLSFKPYTTESIGFYLTKNIDFNFKTNTWKILFLFPKSILLYIKDTQFTDKNYPTFLYKNQFVICFDYKALCDIKTAFTQLENNIRHVK